MNNLPLSSITPTAAHLSGGGFFEVAIVPYVSRICPVCLIPLSILHRSHLILNHKGTIITHPEHHNRVRSGSGALRSNHTTTSRPHRDLITTSSRPHNTLTKPDLSISAISARWASLSKNLEL